MKLTTLLNVAILKNGITTLGGLIMAVGGACQALGYSEYGLELIAFGGALAAIFAKDANKSSKMLGIK